MTTVKLTKRLTAAAGYLRRGKRVADVGCDHGKLCGYLITNDIASFCIATDINEKPLNKAKTLFDKLGITGMTRTVLCDGLSGIDADSVDDVVIAGLGFDVISGIIDGAPWLKDKDKRLVLVPSTRHARLREWLYLGGFVIADETAVFENGHCYTVMSVEYSGSTKQIGAGFAAMGRINAQTEDGAKYIDKELERAKKIAAVASGTRSENAADVVEYIEKEIKR